MRRPMRAANARQNGASRITAGMSAIRPRRRKGVFGEALPATLANDSKTNAMTKKTTPGTTDLRTFLGGIGRPESASCTGTVATVLAGRPAARYVATMASPIEGPITTQGSWNGPITWCPVPSIVGR